MRHFVFWTGMLSLAAGVALQISALAERLMPTEPPGLMTSLFDCVAIFLGIMLLICTRDLRTRGPLVAWEGVLRIGGGAVLVGYGLFGDRGIHATIAGAGDMLIGIIYLVGLPRHLGVPLAHLLLDKR